MIPRKPTAASLRRILLASSACAVLVLFCQCSTFPPGTASKVVVSVKEQKLAVYQDGKLRHKYPVSTSKFGEGDEPGSYRTPLGTMKVAQKIGDNAPKGAVFKSRRRTGEILRPNAPGRDPIVSRILWLAGTESHNKNAYRRYIYIHGTAEESKVGQAASYGCIRMKSRDVIRLYRKVGEGTEVEVVRGSLPGSMLQTTIAPALAAVNAIAKPEEQPEAVRVPTPSAKPRRTSPTLVLSTYGDGGSSWTTPSYGLDR